MNPQPEYIQLENQEDAASVRDRLSFIRGKRVLLIWPEDGSALPRKLDLVLVQREARRRVIQLALVTHDNEVMIHADELNISTFETIAEAEKSRWKRGRTRVFVQRHHKPQHSPEPDDLMPVASRVRSPQRGLSGAVRTIVRVGVLLLVLATLASALYVTVPSATVTLPVAQENIVSEVTITADPAVQDVDIEQGIIPATIVRANVQTVQQIATTGSQEGTATRAIGVVTLTNQTAQRIEVPANTRLSTSAGTPIFFRTTSPVTVPAGEGQRVEVAIEADDDSRGSIGNVDAGLINRIVGDLADSLTVLNVSSTTGGENQTISLVTDADRERLMGIVRGQLQALAYTEMEANLSETQTIVIDTVHIPDELLRSDWISFSHEAGQESDTLTLSMRAIVEALVIDDRLAQQVVFARISGDKPPHLVLQPERFSYTRGPVLETTTGGQIQFTAYGSGSAIANVDVPQLQSVLAGQSLEDAERLVRRSVYLAPDAQLQIALMPAFFGRMPLLPVRIHIESEVAPCSENC